MHLWFLNKENYGMLKLYIEDKSQSFPDPGTIHFKQKVVHVHLSSLLNCGCAFERIHLNSKQSINSFLNVPQRLIASSLHLERQKLFSFCLSHRSSLLCEVKN